MPDVLTEEQRSYCMSRICAKNTVPELTLRKAISSHGIRGYRLHYRLPGKPDIVFPGQKVAVFVDGCFWHKCPICFKSLSTNKRYWVNKISSNVKRDKIINRSLRKDGWVVIRFWEHSIRNDINSCLAALAKSDVKGKFYKVENIRRKR